MTQIFTLLSVVIIHFCCGPSTASKQQHNLDSRTRFKLWCILKFITFYHNTFSLTGMHCNWPGCTVQQTTQITTWGCHLANPFRKDFMKMVCVSCLTFSFTSCGDDRVQTSLPPLTFQIQYAKVLLIWTAFHIPNPVLKHFVNLDRFSFTSFASFLQTILLNSDI